LLLHRPAEKYRRKRFQLASDFQTPLNRHSGDLRRQPLSILALRGTYNQRNDFLITTTPVADLKKPLSSDALYFRSSRMGGFTTSLLLLNTSDATETALSHPGWQRQSSRGRSNRRHSRFILQIFNPPAGLFRFQSDGFRLQPKRMGSIGPGCWNEGARGLRGLRL